MKFSTCYLIVACFTVAGASSLFGQATHITNTGFPTIADGILNVGRNDASTATVIDVLALHRTSSGTAAAGIGGSILFRNEVSNNGVGLSGRISSIFENATVGAQQGAMQFDVYGSGGSTPANFIYLDAGGVGIGKTNPVAMFDVESPIAFTGAFRGPNQMYLGFFEQDLYRGYLGTFAGNAEDMDFGTGFGNATGKVHLTIQASPKFTVDAAGKVGIATTTPATVLDVQGPTTLTTHLIKGEANYSGNADVRAVEGLSMTADGYGIGGYFTGGYRGIYAFADGGAYTGGVYGGYFTTAGDNVGTRYAVYATASGGATNWAGYFASGDVYVSNDLRIGISSDVPGYKVSVDGKIICEELRIQNSASWPDYVFADDYNLMPLSEVEKSIRTHRHLPGIPSASVVAAEGIAVSEMQIKMMEKIEELTLYTIEQQKMLEAQQKEIDMLRKMIVGQE